MKHKKDKPESIVFSNSESTEILFQKIKGWEIISQVEFTVSFDNPKRKELFEKIIEAVTNETVKQNISLIVQRIEQAAFEVSGYTPSEIEYYQSLFAKDFYTVLHSEKYQTYIEDKIRELHFYCKGLEQDLRTNQYEFLEDREQDKNQFTEAERYKFYLESFIIHLKNPPPQQPETKTDKLKTELGKYGFFELPKVKELSASNKQSLIELISKNPMPYGIAMFDFLDFCEYLDREQGTKYKANNILSKLFKENAKDGTSAKHYRRSLIKLLPRYKAGEYKETVKTDYQKLK